MILIVYTKAYRNGSEMFERTAETMLLEFKQTYNKEIVCRGITGKKELTEIFNTISDRKQTIDEYHFIGHSGMYGPMYGTVKYPEQYSPYELKNLVIPFSASGKAFFHCCRSARWFAPFFADAFKIESYGYHWYTAFSSSKKKYRRVRRNSKSVYAIGCKGYKSHGLIGTLKKHLGFQPLEVMNSFLPGGKNIDSTYNEVANEYNRVFQDIKVRKDEWNWLNKHLPDKQDIVVADIGCGNGALLKELSPKIKMGIGLDISASLIENAKKLNESRENIQFKLIDSPKLPLEDKSIDLFVSLLSFRYLDWDPLMDEIKRVLTPNGKILIIDMVTVSPKWYELPQLITSKFKHYIQRYTNPVFYKNLTQLVSKASWKNMLKYNPIRSEHEMKWYLESRFPGKRVEKINVGWNSCILAFDSGKVEAIRDIHLTYP